MLMHMRQTQPKLQFTHMLPYGAVMHDQGVQFVIFSRHATEMRLLLYDDVEDREPTDVIDFDPLRDRWGDIWSVFMPGITAGQLYHFQCSGPNDPSRGLRFSSLRPVDRPVRQSPGRKIPAVDRRDYPAAQMRGD